MKRVDRRSQSADISITTFCSGKKFLEISIGEGKFAVNFPVGERLLELLFAIYGNLKRNSSSCLHWM